MQHIHFVRFAKDFCEFEASLVWSDSKEIQRRYRQAMVVLALNPSTRTIDASGSL